MIPLSASRASGLPMPVRSWISSASFSTSTLIQQQGPRSFGVPFPRPPQAQVQQQPRPQQGGQPPRPLASGPVSSPRPLQQQPQAQAGAPRPGSAGAGSNAAASAYSSLAASFSAPRPAMPRPPPSPFGLPPRPAQPGSSGTGPLPPRPPPFAMPGARPPTMGPPRPGMTGPRPLQHQHQQGQGQGGQVGNNASSSHQQQANGGVSVMNIFAGAPRPPPLGFSIPRPQGSGQGPSAAGTAPAPPPPPPLTGGGSIAAFAQMRANLQRLRLQREARLKAQAATRAAARATAVAGAANALRAGGAAFPGGPSSLAAGAAGAVGGAGTVGRAAATPTTGSNRVSVGMFGKLSAAKKALLMKQRKNALGAAAGAGGAGGRALFQSKRVIIRDDQTIRALAEAAGVKTSRLLSKLEELGEGNVYKSADDVIDPDTAEILVQELGHTAKRQDTKRKDRLPTPLPDAEEAAKLGLPHRAPIVTVMGHVDAGKTTLLDALRGTSVAEREAGGITQGVAAFSVSMKAESKGVGDRRAPGGKAPKATKDKDTKKKGAAATSSSAVTDEDAELAALEAELAAEESADSAGKKKAGSIAAHVDVMTFLDTPGHALFGSMRQRGAALTDIVVLVVDGKDGVMPQTKECVETIVKADIPTIVAVTKSDLLSDSKAACEAVGKQLLELGLAVEAFGGDAPCIAVSAKTGDGLQDLKDAIAVQAEMLDLRAAQDEKTMGEATVIDARLLKGTGLVVDAVVRWGQLKVGDVVVCGEEFGRVKAVQTDVVGAASVNRRVALAAGAESSQNEAEAEAAAGNNNKKDKKKENGKGGKNGNSNNNNKGAADALDDPEAAAAAGYSLVGVEAALPGTPVRILGLKGVPIAGEMVLSVADKKEDNELVSAEEIAKQIVEGRRRRREAQELFRVAAADAVKRAAERSEYNKVRERRLALKAAQQREQQRRKLRKAGAPIPPDLELQPWEVLILKEQADGKITAGSSGGNDRASSRVQGGQQTDVGMSFASAAAMADKKAAAASGAEGEGASKAADAEAASADGATASVGPVPVAFITKSDSAASLVALQDAVSRISAFTDEVLPRVVNSSVGEVSEKDVQLAADMGAHLLCFNAKVSQQVAKQAERKKITIINGRVIYHVLDAACELLAGMLKPTNEEETVAVAEIKQVFVLNQNKKSDAEKVAGCVITEGTFPKSGMNGYRVLRGADNEVVGEVTSLLNLMHFKDKVETVKKGSECGISFPSTGGGFNDFMPGDRIVAWKMKTVPRKLKVTFD